MNISRLSLLTSMLWFGIMSLYAGAFWMGHYSTINESIDKIIFCFLLALIGIFMISLSFVNAIEKKCNGCSK